MDGTEMFSVIEELAGKHVLVTGGTGFMGKVLLEKLLRCCPDIACIYVLIRPKKGASPQERIKGITSTPLFEPLLAQSPEVVGKLRAVAGDCSQLRLGLSADDEALLVDKVSYVFHAAATVRFDDPLKSALLLNTRGTREVVDLCRKMPNLKALEYVSTTYCFTNEPLLREQHYPTELDWRTMIRLAETEEQNVLDAFARKIMDFQPNTYTFTKALAENVINDARDDIPVIIFRPAVVISSICEPFVGWLDNLYGPFAIWAGVLKGVLHFSYGNPDVALSYTPVDWAIRGMILCAVARSLKSKALCSQPGAVDVVHLEGSSYTRLSYRSQWALIQKPENLCRGVSEMIRYPTYYIGTNYVYYWLGTIFSQLPYGLVLDAILRARGQKPRLLSTYRKIFHVNDALAYFMLNEFPIVTEKCDVLHYAVHPKERRYFGIIAGDESGFNYDPENFPIEVLNGMYKYVFKENPDPTREKVMLQKLYALEIAMRSFVAIVLYFTVGKVFLHKAAHLLSLT